MHIYPQDYNTYMINKWIESAIEHNGFSIDIRFNVPDDLHSMKKSECTNQTDMVHNILGEISQAILTNNNVDGSITFVGTTATIFITQS